MKRNMKKRVSFLLALILAAALLMASGPLAVAADGDIPVTQLPLTIEVRNVGDPIPQGIGEETDQYTVSAGWYVWNEEYQDYNSYATGNYEAGVTYCASFAVTAKPGYSVADLENDLNAITVNGGHLGADDVVWYQESSGALRVKHLITFGGTQETEIAELDLTAETFGVGSPIPDGPGAIHEDADTYSVDADWYVMDTNGGYTQHAHGTFEEGRTYCICFFVTPKAGYSVKSLEQNQSAVTVNGGPINYECWYSATNNWLVVKQLFTFEVTKVTSVVLKITAPAAGKAIPSGGTSAGSAVSGSGYGYNYYAGWFVYNSSEKEYTTPATGKFEEGKTYCATFTVMPDPDFTLAYLNSTNVTVNNMKANRTFSYDPDEYVLTVRHLFVVPVPISKASVTGISNKTFTGKNITLPLVVKIGGKTLKSGTDYTVTYNNNKNVGRAHITITGKGSYTGTLSKSFVIYPKGTSLVSVTAGSKRFTVKWNAQLTKMASSYVTGYQIQYSTSVKFAAGNKTVTVKGPRTVSKTITGLKGNKGYYVRIRTWKTVGDKTFYSSWSKAKSVKTKN